MQQAEERQAAGSADAAPSSQQAVELLATGGADRAVRVHETRTATLAVEGMSTVLSPVLCLDAAPPVACAAAGGAPRFATGGGSGSLMSDASVALWRVEPVDKEREGSADKRQRREEPAREAEAGGHAAPGGGVAEQCFACTP